MKVLNLTTLGLVTLYSTNVVAINTQTMPMQHPTDMPQIDPLLDFSQVSIRSLTNLVFPY